MTTVKATDEGLVYSVSDCLLCPLNAEGYCRPLGGYWTHEAREHGLPPARCPLRQGSIVLNLSELARGFDVVPDSNPDGFVLREIALVADPDPGCVIVGADEPQNDESTKPKRETTSSPWTGGFLPWGKITQ